ncbi:MAG: retropepsin-like aspartic protease [Terracidiphilus sp.]|jgi:hypothetical protein
MNNRTLTRTAIYLALVLILDAASAPSLHAAPAVRFKLLGDALVVIPVTINDEGPFYFVLDTGADTTLVDTALAKKLALPTLQSGNLTTIVGTQTVATNWLSRLAVGGAQLDHLRVFQVDLTSLHRIDSRIAGVVGQDFLSHFNYLLDYRAQSVRFEEGNEVQNEIDGDPVPIEAHENRMILAADADLQGRAHLRLLLDSGTNTLVLMGPVSQRLRCMAEEDGIATSYTGAAPARFGRVDLTVASHAFSNLPVNLETDAAPKSVGDGLLPLVLFRAIYVNNSRSFVVLNPRAKRPVR